MVLPKRSLLRRRHAEGADLVEVALAGAAINAEEGETEKTATEASEIHPRMAVKSAEDGVDDEADEVLVLQTRSAQHASLKVQGPEKSQQNLSDVEGDPAVAVDLVEELRPMARKHHKRQAQTLNLIPPR